MRSSLVMGAIFVGAIGYGFLQGHNPLKSDTPMAVPDAAPGQSPTAPRKMRENVVAYYTGDAAMNGAKEKARATQSRFRELKAVGTPGTYTVKFPLTMNGETEHIWLQVTEWSDRGYGGLLANDPVNGTKYHMGDRLTVAAADVEDWMVNTGSAIYGGYTARVALDQMPKDEQDKYRSMFKD